ncbi:MAG: hypothetical protein HY290_17930 [Planctomycetia bacterium]|nr:hypothetical protein [Planctomycetia bacterium]
MAVALIVVGVFVIDRPGVVIRTQVKIVNGQADLPPQLVRLNNWCFVRWKPFSSVCLWSGIGMSVLGALALKVILSHAVADFARPPQTGDEVR